MSMGFPILLKHVRNPVSTEGCERQVGVTEDTHQGGRGVVVKGQVVLVLRMGGKMLLEECVAIVDHLFDATLAFGGLTGGLGGEVEEGR